MDENKFFEKNHTIKEDSISKNNFLHRLRTYIYQKFDVWDIFDLFPYGWRMYYYDHIKPIFKPRHTRIRKSIPRNWSDICTLIENVNFEMIKSFYEDEYIKGYVDWEADKYHKEFSEWLKKAYKYIIEIRPKLEIDLQNAYPPSLPLDEMFKPFIDENGRKMYKMVDDGVPYEKKYAEVNRIENLIDDNDTEILIQMIKFRKYFWT